MLSTARQLGHESVTVRSLVTASTGECWQSRQWEGACGIGGGLTAHAFNSAVRLTSVPFAFT